MNALIDLKARSALEDGQSPSDGKCREYMTVTIGDRERQVKLSGTINEPYFCGRDVCEVLGYDSPKNALHRYVDQEEKKSLKELLVSESETNFLGSNKPLNYHDGKATFISETGLYNLIMHSNAPFAKEFQKLVCKTILPSIRKYGSYQVESQLSLAMEQLAIKDKSHEEETRELKQRADKAEKDAEEQRQYSLILKELAINDQKRPLDERIYISTSKAYAGHNRFKVGGVESMDKLKPRFSGYNGRSSVDDMWYYSDLFKVANFKAAENHMPKGHMIEVGA
jgi:prophage antirepressor-like protein